jgi:hypothetical protein
VFKRRSDDGKTTFETFVLLPGLLVENLRFGLAIRHY